MFRLLPRNIDEFSKKDYWENFFKTRKAAFEWYGDFLQHSEFFHKYIKRTDRVLVVGCGNSDLGLMIYDKLNVKNVVNIDISDTLIHQMQQKHCSDEKKHGLTYECIDVFSLKTCIDCEKLQPFSCIIDKGTLDAIHSQENSELNAFSMFNNVQFALNLMGRYVIITLAQKHIVESICKYFIERAKEWIVNCHQLTSNQGGEAESQDSFPLPVFGFILTKLQPSDGLPRVNLFTLGSSDPIQLSGTQSELSQQLAAWIAQEQNWSLLRRDIGSDNQAELRFACPRTGLTVFYALLAKLQQPERRIKKNKKSLQRYTLGKIDAVFLVPFGQNDNPRYTDEKNRLNLCHTLHVNSLLVVFASPRYFHDDLEAIKANLSSVLCGLTLGDTDAQGAPILSTPDSYVRTKIDIPSLSNDRCDLQLDRVQFRMPESDELYTLKRLVLPASDLHPVLATNASFLSVPSSLAPRDAHVAIWLEILALQNRCSRLACYGLPPLGGVTPELSRHFHILLSDTEPVNGAVLQSAFAELYADYPAVLSCGRCTEPVLIWSDSSVVIHDDCHFDVVLYDPIGANSSNYVSHFHSDSLDRLSDFCMKNINSHGWVIIVYEDVSGAEPPRIELNSEMLDFFLSYVVSDPMFADPKTQIDIYHHKSINHDASRSALLTRIQALKNQMGFVAEAKLNDTRCGPLNVCRQIESLLM